MAEVTMEELERRRVTRETLARLGKEAFDAGLYDDETARMPEGGEDE